MRSKVVRVARIARYADRRSGELLSQIFRSVRALLIINIIVALVIIIVNIIVALVIIIVIIISIIIIT